MAAAAAEGRGRCGRAGERAWRLLGLGALVAAAPMGLQGCGGGGRASGGRDTVVNGTAYVVETIPLDTTLELAVGARHTWEVLTQFIGEAREKIDFTAMYWRLLDADSQKRNASWGADRGAKVHAALRDAAKRGVMLRVICGIGISGTDELEAIQKEFPDRVTFQVYNASRWYDGGIMHMKAWIFDDTRALVTSSNTDWKSLSQVKEMGVAVEGPPRFLLVQDLQLYFDRWWRWTSKEVVDSLPEPRRRIFDPYLQLARRVPCFSSAGTQTPDARGPTCANPMASLGKTAYNLERPMPLVLNGTLGLTLLSCSPPEVCDAPRDAYSQFAVPPPGRTWDGNAVIQTILMAQTHVNLTVMDFLPSAMYDSCAGAWWPALNDAILAKLAQGVQVRLLISRWAHTFDHMADYLLALDRSAQAVVDGAPVGGGSFEIRLFELPGWRNATGLPGAPYPDFSRVNHAKYIVTDRRFNVGTSNMEWSYYHNTAGTSLNSDHPLLREQLAAAFARDWSSEYAAQLEPSLARGSTAGRPRSDPSGESPPVELAV